MRPIWPWGDLVSSAWDELDPDWEQEPAIFHRGSVVLAWITTPLAFALAVIQIGFLVGWWRA